MAVVVSVVGATILSFTNGPAPASTGIGRQWLQHALLQQDGITIRSPVEPVSGAISAARAIAFARGDLGFLAREPATALLVRFTDPSYGKEVNGGVRNPIWVRKVAYAVAFPHVAVPLLGPPQDNPGQTQDQVGVYFIDAYSGQRLEFVTPDPQL